MAGQISLNNKKQGVSGQSLNVSSDVKIHRYEKDFRSKTLIKEAIMENDFLKNLSPCHVRQKRADFFFIFVIVHMRRCASCWSRCTR